MSHESQRTSIGPFSSTSAILHQKQVVYVSRFLFTWVSDDAEDLEAPMMAGGMEI